MLEDVFVGLAAIEAGELTDEDSIVSLYQALVMTDIVWRLDGSHILTAVALIDAGLVSL